MLTSNFVVPLIVAIPVGVGVVAIVVCIFIYFRHKHTSGKCATKISQSVPMAGVSEGDVDIKLPEKERPGSIPVTKPTEEDEKNDRLKSLLVQHQYSFAGDLSANIKMVIQAMKTVCIVIQFLDVDQ